MYVCVNFSQMILIYIFKYFDTIWNVSLVYITFKTKPLPAVIHTRGLWIRVVMWSILQWWQKNTMPLEWRHNGHDSVSSHQPRDYLLNHLFKRRSQKTSKLRVTGLCAGNSPKWPVTRKMFPILMTSSRHLCPQKTVCFTSGYSLWGTTVLNGAKMYFKCQVA